MRISLSSLNLFGNMISEEGLQKYIDLYQEKYGILLEREVAFTMMSKLLRLVQTIYYQPVRDAQNKKYTQKIIA